MQRDMQQQNEEQDLAFVLGTYMAVCMYARTESESDLTLLLQYVHFKNQDVPLTV